MDARQDKLERTWRKLSKIVANFFMKRQAAFDEKKLQKAIREVSQMGMGKELHTRMEVECRKLISVAVMSLAASNSESVDFLRLVMRFWEDFRTRMGAICELATHNDEVYRLLLPPLWNVGINTLQYQISLHPEIRTKTVAGLLILIDMERSGALVLLDKFPQMLSGVRIFRNEKMYHDDFEKPFLRNTKKFYALESSKYNQLGVSDYLELVKKRLHEERQRCKLYLNAKTKKPLISATKKQLLPSLMCYELVKHIHVVIASKSVGALRRIYHVLLRDREPKSVHKEIHTCITTTRLSISNEEGDMVLKFYELMTSIEKTCRSVFFSNRVDFVLMLRWALDTLLPEERFEERFLKYLDKKLREEQELEVWTDFLHKGMDILDCGAWFNEKLKFVFVKVHTKIILQ